MPSSCCSTGSRRRTPSALTKVLSSLPGTEEIFAAHAPGPAANEKAALRLVADTALAGVPHAGAVAVRGGPGRRQEQFPAAAVPFLTD